MPAKLKKHDALPLDDRVVRFVAWNRLEKHPDDETKVIGILPIAFQEQEASVTWMDYFEGTDDERLQLSARAMRASQESGKLGAKGHFAKAVVRDVHQNAQTTNTKIRIIYMPEDKNDAHSEIHGLEFGTAELWLDLATNVFGDLVMNSLIPA